MAFWLSALFYFTWRAGVLNFAHPVFAWFALGAELLAFARIALAFTSLLQMPRRAWRTAPAGLAVDVFVTTYDEPLSGVRQTLESALRLHYPHTTWLLDDGNRGEMRALAAELGCAYTGRRENSGAKAGNLNAALTHTHGTFVAIFDADHAVDATFLDRTLGYFHDERIAIVQTPHEFANAGSYDHFTLRRRSTIQSTWHHIVQGARDASNTTIFCGSSAVLRRSALAAIGGFATGTIDEDVHTSMRLHAAGWHSAFHAEILTAGIAAPAAAAADRQRLRWAQDAVQLVTRARLLTLRGLSNAQRQSYILHVVSNLEGWRYSIVYALPVIILVTGTLPLTASAGDFSVHFAPYALLCAIATYEFTRGHTRFFESAVYNMARTPIAIHATFSAFFERRFHVTPKTHGAPNASPFAFFPWLVIATNAAAIAYALRLAYAGTSALAPDALAVVALWASYHIATALRLIALTRRCDTRRAGSDVPDRSAQIAALRAADRGDCGGLLARLIDPDVPDRLEIAIREGAKRHHGLGADDPAM